MPYQAPPYHAPPYWVTALSDVEDEEIARKSRVAQQSTRIFDSLVKTFERAITIYNERHPAQFGSSAGISKNVEDGSFKIQVFKFTEPQAELKVTFPINDGLIQYDQKLAGVKHFGPFEFEIKIGDAPDLKVTYARSYSEDEVVRLTLTSILFTEDVIKKAEEKAEAEHRIRCGLRPKT